MGAFDLKGKQPPPIQGVAILFTSSRLFTVVESGVYRLECVGAGGGGNWVVAAGPQACSAPGAGGGGYSMREVFLAAGTRLDIVIGAAGVGAGSTSGFPANAFGNSGTGGGLTSIRGGSVSMGATGGSPSGNALANSTATALGGAGGYGYGGDVNLKGGDGGDAKCVTAASISAAAAGGGSAATPYGNGIKGGSVIGQTAGSGASAGGSGIWTAGQSFSGTANGNGAGGSGAFSAAQSTQEQYWSPLFANTLTDVRPFPYAYPSRPLLQINGVFQQSAVNVHQGPGCGGFGYSMQGITNYFQCGWFGGAGGASSLSAVSGANVSKSALRGGGGAGSAAADAAAGMGSIGAASGGPGLVVIERVA